MTVRASQLPAGTRRWEGDETFVIDRPIEMEAVIVHGAPGDSISLADGCTGRLEYAEVITESQDGIKVQNSSSRAARQFTIESGYLRAEGSHEGAHQDGIQVMGGSDLTFRRFSIDGFDTQGYFVNRGGQGATTPTRIRLEDSYIGPGGATAVNVNNAVAAAVERCHIWRTHRFGRGLIGLPVGTNTIYPASAPFVVPAGYPTPGSMPGPGPDDPEPGELEALLARIDELEAALHACGVTREELAQERLRLIGVIDRARRVLDDGLTATGITLSASQLQHGGARS